MIDIVDDALAVARVEFTVIDGTLAITGVQLATGNIERPGALIVDDALAVTGVEFTVVDDTLAITGVQLATGDIERPGALIVDDALAVTGVQFAASVLVEFRYRSGC